MDSKYLKSFDLNFQSRTMDSAKSARRGFEKLLLKGYPLNLSMPSKTYSSTSMSTNKTESFPEHVYEFLSIKRKKVYRMTSKIDNKLTPRTKKTKIMITAGDLENNQFKESESKNKIPSLSIQEFKKECNITKKKSEIDCKLNKTLEKFEGISRKGTRKITAKDEEFKNLYRINTIKKRKSYNPPNQPLAKFTAKLQKIQKLIKDPLLYDNF